MASRIRKKTLIALAIAAAFGMQTAGPVVAQDQPEGGTAAEPNPSAPAAESESATDELDFLLNNTASESAPPAATAAETPTEPAAAPAPVAQPEAPQPEQPTQPQDPVVSADEAAGETKAQVAQQARASAIEEIVVTARRTAENVQDVPVAIAAMSSEDLRREQINSPQDLQGRVPSLVIGPNNQMRNTETPTVRGQGSQFGAPPGVVMYMSEVPLVADPIANYQGGPGKFFDLANVQVLKGSQGTLFGRNTTGGAMLIEPQKPTDEVYGTVSMGVTSLSGRSYEGVANTPLGETAFVRVGGQAFERDGFTKDVATGKDYDSKGYWTGRFGLTWRPNDQIENYFVANTSDSDDNGTATVIKRVNREGLNRSIPGAIGLGALAQLPLPIDLAQTANLGCQLLNFFGPSTNCGQDILDEQEARGNRRVQLSGDPNDKLKVDSFVDQFSFQLTDNLTLRNIVSYSTMEHSYRWDLDGSRAGFNEFTNPSDVLNADVESLTEEIQLQGNAMDGALKYVLGAFYEDTKAKGDIIATSLLFVDVTQAYDQDKESFAPFFQGTYDLGTLSESLSGLSLTAGVRKTTDKTSGTASIRQLALGLIPLVDKSFDAKVKHSEPTWTLGLDYKFDEHLIYGKVSSGYKSGGINTISVNPAHQLYDPELVTNYELGQKSDFLIGGLLPLRLNSAIYYTDYTDMQRSAPDSYVDPNNPSPIPQLGQANFNVGQAWVAGFEMDATVMPYEGLVLVGTYGYTRAEYDEFTFQYDGATPQLDCTGQEVARGGIVDMACVPFTSTPRHQFSLSGRYQLPVDPSLGTIETSLTYVWVDKQYTSPTTPPEGEPGAWLPQFNLLNGSINWSNIRGTNLSAQLFGTNLTNEVYRISNSNQWNLTYFQSSIWSEPRIVGLNLRYDLP